MKVEFDHSFLLQIGSAKPLLSEVNDLKRIRVAGHSGSWAERGFVRSWTTLIAGEEPARLALLETAQALVAARMGGIDAAVLVDGGLSLSAIKLILRNALIEVTRPLGEAVSEPLEAILGDLVDIPKHADDSWMVPEFVGRLQAQPRAGATRPGFPRLMLEPPENHAEHCYVTAVYAAFMAPFFKADPAVAFLAGLSHHFHNAYLPDSGFTGEELLGEHLLPVMDRFTKRAMEQLPGHLVGPVTQAREILPDAETAEGQAFHAGDVLDRVLQMEQYARVAAFETRHALVDLDLVHPGPVQAFHHAVLAAAGLQQ